MDTASPASLAFQRPAAPTRWITRARPELAPQSPGLLALSQGLSLLYADDHAMLQAALPLYDALYAWCRGARESQG